MSQSSKALSIDIASPAGMADTSIEDLADGRTAFAFTLPGPTLVEEDLLVVEPPRDTGVLGGEFKVTSRELNEGCVRCVLGLLISYIDEDLIPKSISSRLAL